MTKVIFCIARRVKLYLQIHCIIEVCNSIGTHYIIAESNKDPWVLSFYHGLRIMDHGPLVQDSLSLYSYTALLAYVPVPVLTLRLTGKDIRNEIIEPPYNCDE
jgi:hypothetical protein